MYNYYNKLMNEEITFHQVHIRFQEPDNCWADCIARLADFTNYDGLVAANNPIDAINVDIRSYGFDHVKVKKELFALIENVRYALGAHCTWACNEITYSSNDTVGVKAKEPIREVSYTIDIL